jgi:hypothetical protein
MPIESRVERQLVERHPEGDLYDYRIALEGTSIREARVFVPRGVSADEALWSFGVRQLMLA